MKCKNCESNFNEEYEFCPKCGALNKLQSEIEEQNKSSGEILFEKVTSINQNIKKLVVGMIISVTASLIPVFIGQSIVENQYTEQTLGNLAFKIYHGLEEGVIRLDSYRNFEYSSSDDECKIKIDTLSINRFNTENKFIEYINHNNRPTKTKKINNKKWTYFEDDREYLLSHNYIIKDDQYYYHVEFIIEEDTGICSKYHKKVIKSLKLN